MKDNKVQAWALFSQDNKVVEVNTTRADSRVRKANYEKGCVRGPVKVDIIVDKQ
jgi:hypothetical protein